MAAALAAVPAAAFQVDIRPQPIAHVFDEKSRTIAPLFGLPGAAVWGQPLALPFEVARASIRRGRALAVTSASALVAIPAVGAASLQWIDLAPAFVPTDLVLNTAGTRGLVLDRALGLAQFVSALDTAPVLSGPAPIAPGWTAISLARDSNCALVGRFEEGSGAVDRVCADRDPLRLHSAAGFEPTALCWLAGDRQALVADRGGNRLFLLDTAAAGGVLELSPGAVRSPVLLEAMPGGEALVVNDSSPELQRVTGEGKPVARAVPLPSQVKSIERLPSGFVLGVAREDGSVFLGDLEEEQVYVVPSR